MSSSGQATNKSQTEKNRDEQTSGFRRVAHNSLQLKAITLENVTQDLAKLRSPCNKQPLYSCVLSPVCRKLLQLLRNCCRI